MRFRRLYDLFMLGVLPTAMLACGGAPESSKIPSPDPNAKEAPASQSAAGEQSSGAKPPSSKDVASICKDAKPVSALERPIPLSLSLERPRPEKGDGSFGPPSDLKAKGNDYTLADLQALEKKAQYLELLRHIEDIPPAKRDAAWDALLTRAATAFVGSLSSKADAFDGFMVAEHLVERYPQLTKSTDFMQKRGDVGKSSFGQCFKMSYSGEECVKMALDFIKVSGTDPKVKLAVAKVVRLNQNAYNAVPFFQAAVQSKDDSACGDEDLQLATTAGLGLPSDYANAKGARDIAQNMCFKQLKDPILKQLTGDEGGGYFTQNACAVLRANGVVK